MRRGTLLSIAFVITLAGSLTMFSMHLASQDTSLRSFLSGAMLTVIGGPGDGQLLRVNLQNGSLALYEDGKLYRTAKIAGSGNPLDSTASPTGKFRILSKEPRHISRASRTGVVMPWAMRFFEGYYFHDIPLTASGEIINTRYSHGCIRLGSMLAKEVYAWTKIGARVEIYRAALARDETSTTIYRLTEDGHRLPIASAEAFDRLGYHWQDVVTIPSEELSALLLGPVLN